MGLTQVSECETGRSINNLPKFCYSYDSAGRKYVLNVTRIAGGVMILLIAVFVFILTFKKKKNIYPVNGHTGEFGKGSF